MSLRVVCDTNIVLSALLFQEGQLAWFRGAWNTRQVIPLVSAETVTELIRTLSFPKFKLSSADQEILLGDYLPFAETMRPKNVRGLPHCRDPKDRMFLALATFAKADALVTGDKDLLALTSRLSVPIVTPAQLRERCNQ